MNPWLHGRIGEELIIAENIFSALPETEQKAAYDRLYVCYLVLDMQEQGLTRLDSIRDILEECFRKSATKNGYGRKAHNILRRWGLRPDFNGICTLRKYVERLDYFTSEKNHVFLMVDPNVAYAAMGLERRHA